MNKEERKDLLLFIDRAKERNWNIKYLSFLDKQGYSIKAAYKNKKQLTNNKKD